MNSDETATELRFDPPGPGSWELDAVHFPRPATRYWTELHPEPFSRGFSEFTRYYGMLLDALEYRYVNGFAYSSARPAADDEVPRRFQRAEEVFERKLWRDQLRDWDETFKPASISAHRELQSVEPDELSDDDMVAYLTRCRDHHAEMIFQHMRFSGAAMLPTGDLLAHVGDWTGLPPAHLLGMMRGAAPVSAGASAEFAQLIATVTDDPSARQLLESDREPEQVLDGLRALEGDAGAAVSAYLDLVGCRLLDGFDIGGRYALELPDVLVRAIAAAVEAGGTPASDAGERIAEVRAQVPEQHRAQFDELLEEARSTYRIRDERGVYSDIWASGIMRRAVLAAGRRLARNGRIHDAEHLVDAGFEEMRSLVAGGDRPTAEELAERYVSDPAEFDRIVQGDVLVTESTTEAFNILLPLLGGIVTDSGGLLSHSAIVAREYGIPGVVGTREATERIADGALVRVDGDAGEVRVQA